MFKTKNGNALGLIICVVIPMAIGSITGLILSETMFIFNNLNKPPLTPPGFVFPIVWTILYFLMGISCYLVIRDYTGEKEVRTSVVIYVIQLVVNTLWSFVFFGAQDYRSAFFILLALWFVIIMMILEFGKTSPLAARLQIPYVIWVFFAGYLNFMICRIN
ncbi:MAG: TspO/MBR family protein [Anaerovoracaceae bacterium]